MVLICLGVLVWLALLVAVLGVCGLAAQADDRPSRRSEPRRGTRARTRSTGSRAALR